MTEEKPTIIPSVIKVEIAPHKLLISQRAMFWLLATAALLLFLYVFSSILLPFLAGLALAYVLNPVADRLQKLGISRFVAAIVILVFCVVFVSLALMVVIPILINQLADVAVRLPDYMNRLHSVIVNIDPGWLEKTFGIRPGALQSSASTILSQGATFLGGVFKQIWSSGIAIANIVSLFVITPVVAFYMLLDWDRMVESVNSVVPPRNAETVGKIARDINASTAGFLRGQSTICLILAIFYAVGLTLVGLNFGLLIGLIVGFISFIPYVGSLVGLVLALGVAVVQFWPDWIWVAAVLVVFFAGQFLEGNILQPKLMGRSVGLHPVWLMFSLFAFGYLFGFVGLLIAVPAAAAVAVLVRFAVGRYLASPLYSGVAEEPTAQHIDTE